MSKVEDIVGRVRDLTAAELRSFRNWFTQFDADLWDEQFKADVHTGKLDELAERALRDHQAGRSTEL